jgi:hypothetical protein
MENGLQTILKETFIPTYRAVHDCVDTGADLTITGGAGKIPFPCNCLGRNKFNVKEYWDPVTSNIIDGFEWAVLFTSFKFVLNAPVNTTFKITIEIDHPVHGIIPIESYEIVALKNNIDIPYKINAELYNSDDSDAHIYGFDIYIESDATCTLKSRSIKVVQ